MTDERLSTLQHIEKTQRPSVGNYFRNHYGFSYFLESGAKELLHAFLHGQKEVTIKLDDLPGLEEAIKYRNDLIETLES